MVFSKIKITQQVNTGQSLFAVRATGLLCLVALILTLNIVNFQYKTNTSPINVPKVAPLPIENNKNSEEDQPALVFLHPEEGVS